MNRTATTNRTAPAATSPARVFARPVTMTVAANDDGRAPWGFDAVTVAARLVAARVHCGAARDAVDRAERAATTAAVQARHHTARSAVPASVVAARLCERLDTLGAALVAWGRSVDGDESFSLLAAEGAALAFAASINHRAQ